MKAANGQRVEGKKEFHLITPEGREVYLGHYKSEASATAATRRKFPADWLALCNIVESDLLLRRVS